MAEAFITRRGNGGNSASITKYTLSDSDYSYTSSAVQIERTVFDQCGTDPWRAVIHFKGRADETPINLFLEFIYAQWNGENQILFIKASHTVHQRIELVDMRDATSQYDSYITIKEGDVNVYFPSKDDDFVEMYVMQLDME